MLSEKNVMATIAVKDLNIARKFYEDRLGFEQAYTDGANVISYVSGHATFLVYKSDFAGGYKATVATWDVGDEIESVVKKLNNHGVRFDHYDLPDTKRNGDIHVMGDMKNAWCKDPDGNILCFVGT